MTSPGTISGAAGTRAASSFAWRTREAVRSCMDQGQAHRFSEALVRVAPRPLQRWAEARYDYPVSSHVRSQPLLLVRVPRTGSLSLALMIYGRTSHVPHRTAAFYQSSDPAFFASVTSLAVVRDPWRRAWSSYCYVRSGGTHHLRLDPATRARMGDVGSFEEFVFDRLVPNEGRLHRLDPILHAQSAYVCDRRGRVIVDRLFDFDRMGEVASFMRERGYGDVIPHVNERRERSSQAMPADLRPDVVDAISRVYARDVAVLGFSGCDPLRPAAAAR